MRLPSCNPPTSTAPAPEPQREEPADPITMHEPDDEAVLLAAGATAYYEAAA